MKHTLPSLGDLFDESSYLMRQNFRELAVLVIPRGILPVVAMAVTLALSTNLSLATMAVLLIIEAIIFVILVLQLGPKLIEFTLATAQGRDIDPNAPGAWAFIGSVLIWEAPMQIASLIVRKAGGPVVSILTGLLLLYPNIRVSLRTIVTVAEREIAGSPLRSWELTEGVGWRILLYRWVLMIPAVIVAAILIVGLLLVMMSGIHPLSKATMSHDIPIMLAAICLGMLPLLLYDFFFVTYFETLIYLSLAQQELNADDTLEPIAESL
jgi:hypothetical protein